MNEIHNTRIVCSNYLAQIVLFFLANSATHFITAFVTLLLLTTTLCMAANIKPTNEELAAEKTLGHIQTAAFIQTAILVHCPLLEAVAEKMAAELSEATEFSEHYEVYIVNEPLILAFSLPPNNIFIYSGLLDELENRNQLAAVLAHELAHLADHDTLTMLRYNITERRTQEAIAVTANMGFSFAISNATGQILAKSTKPKLSRKMVGRRRTAEISNLEQVIFGEIGQLIIPEHASRMRQQLAAPAMNQLIYRMTHNQQDSIIEHQADKAAIRYLNQAGYDPNAMIKVLELYGRK